MCSTMIPLPFPAVAGMIWSGDPSPQWIWYLKPGVAFPDEAVNRNAVGCPRTISLGPLTFAVVALAMIETSATYRVSPESLSRIFPRTVNVPGVEAEQLVVLVVLQEPYPLPQ